MNFYTTTGWIIVIMCVLAIIMVTTMCIADYKMFSDDYKQCLQATGKESHTQRIDETHINCCYTETKQDNQSKYYTEEICKGIEVTR